MDINSLLRIALDRRASDLHLKVGNSPIIRIDGRLVPLEDHARISQEEAIEVAFSIMSSGQKERFKEKNELDLAHSAPGMGRFRVNVFQQRGTIGLVFRVVPTRILTIEELNLPSVLEKLAMEQRGLSRRDLEPFIGSRARVAEVLNHKRSLTLPMIRRLHDGLGIPAEVLIGESVAA